MLDENACWKSWMKMMNKQCSMEIPNENAIIISQWKC